MKELLFKFLGKVYSLKIMLVKSKIFGTVIGKEYLHMYSESEAKLPFFRLHAFLKGYKFAHKYIDKKKKSDTVFILGSGESVNDLSKGNWEFIKRNNIIGLNYSFVHPVVPDYFLMEMIPLKEMQDFFLESTKERYSDVDIFFQYKHVIKSGFNLKRYNYPQRAYVHIPHLFPTVHSDVLELYMTDLKLKYGIKLSHLIHHNSHVGCAVMFAQALGYKKIVLLGVDLNGGDYFTNSSMPSKAFPLSEAYKKLNLLRTKYNNLKNDYKNKLHPTINKDLLKDRGCISMDEYFRVYKKIILDNYDVELFINSDKSLLSKDFKVFDFGNKT